MHNLRSQTAQNSLLISNISQQFFRSATKIYISVQNTAATEFNTACKSPNNHKYIIYIINIMIPEPFQLTKYALTGYYISVSEAQRN